MFAFRISRAMDTYTYTVFPYLSAGSQMNAWSQLSAGSKVTVFQMSTKKMNLTNEPGPNVRRCTEDFEINACWGIHSGKYGPKKP